MVHAKRAWTFSLPVLVRWILAVFEMREQAKWENKSQKLSISIQYLNDMFYIKLSERKRRLVVLRKSLVFFGGCRPVASASRCVSVVFGVSVSCVRFWGSTWYSVGVPLLAAGMNTCSCLMSVRCHSGLWRKHTVALPCSDAAKIAKIFQKSYFRGKNLWFGSLYLSQYSVNSLVWPCWCLVRFGTSCAHYLIVVNLTAIKLIAVSKVH